MKNNDIRHERTIHRVLKAKVKQYGNREFFRWNDQVFGFEDFDRQSDKVAAGLQSLGIGKGDKVGIMMGNRPEFLFLWFGLSKLGAIEVPINNAHRGDLLTYMVGTSDCRILVTASQFLDRVTPVLGNLPTVEKVIVLGDTEDLPSKLDKPSMSYPELIENDGSYEEAEVLWSDPFVIMFTSGTTGPSKGSLMPQSYALHMGEIMSEAC
ncbi:MAG: AMP-binding protein, partial [Deltaproteobacteria bacterium]|nr:AMP-binding protein [Deltaproteobacteria bacterium]